MGERWGNGALRGELFSPGNRLTRYSPQIGRAFLCKDGRAALRSSAIAREPQVKQVTYGKEFRAASHQIPPRERERSRLYWSTDARADQLAITYADTELI